MLGGDLFGESRGEIHFDNFFPDDIEPLEKLDINLRLNKLIDRHANAECRVVGILRQIDDFQLNRVKISVFY